MITFHSVNSEQVIFLGDLHGNFDTLLFWMKNFVFKNTAIIVCGDIGFGFHKPEYYRLKLEAINTFCKQSDCRVFFIRGNHDDPEYFDGSNIDKSAYVTFDCVHAVSDYSCIQVWKDGKVVHTILCVGGGVSIDRTWRIRNHVVNCAAYARHANISLSEAYSKILPTHWDNELPVFDDVLLSEISSSGTKIDIVCTHTCPSFVGLKDKEGVKEWLKHDINLEKDMNAERETMDLLYNKLRQDGHPITNWVYGHFHRHMTEEYEGIKFSMLDMCNPERARFDTLEINDYENL